MEALLFNFAAGFLRELYSSPGKRASIYVDSPKKKKSSEKFSPPEKLLPQP